MMKNILNRFCILHSSQRIMQWLTQNFVMVTIPSSHFMTCHLVCDKINMTGATSGAGTSCRSTVPEHFLGQFFFLLFFLNIDYFKVNDRFLRLLHTT